MPRACRLLRVSSLAYLAGMLFSRRRFLSAIALSAATTRAQAAEPLVTGSPPVFGAGPPIGPEVSAATFAQAEKLAQITMRPADHARMATNWREQMAYLTERRTGPRKVVIADEMAPAQVWNPALSGIPRGSSRFVRSAETVALPVSDVDIAFAPLTQLARWLETRAITSRRLTDIYLARLERFQPQLLCTITLTAAQARARAAQADAEIAAGHYRGPLHGVPFGAKDLLDTAGIATTYGAFRTRVPSEDAVVMRRLYDAGAVLVGKLSLGALALNDIWFGGQTRNPFWLEEGSSGSSAGSAAAVSAGLVGFAIGSETNGSLISPSIRCGVTSLRPTFGRVPRTGSMTLAWSQDKLGPMARHVEDTFLVLRAIAGAEATDPSSRDAELSFDATASAKGLRVGYVARWMNEAPATHVEHDALELLTKLGLVAREVKIPDWSYGSLDTLFISEAAASFEALTMSNGLDALPVQSIDGWPNLLRQARFISAVDYVQADRLRRMVALEMERIFSELDVLLVPSMRPDMMTIFNAIGYPALTLRTAFINVDRMRSDWLDDAERMKKIYIPSRRVPHGVTLIGRPFAEGVLGRVGMALEHALGVMGERPSGFAR